MITSAAFPVLILVFSCVLFLVSPVRVVQFISLLFFLLVLLSFLYARILQKSIKVERRIGRLKVACKEKVRLEVVVKNYSRLPADICYINDEAAFLYVYDNQNSGIFSLRPREQKEISYTVSAQDRGLYHAGPVHISTSDPLGLFKVELEAECMLEVMVRPARIPLVTELFPGLPQGALRINNACYEDVTVRRSVREYLSGDELRRINWRASARFSTLYTNVYENTYDVTVFVFLNLAQDDYPMRQKFYGGEKAIEIAAAIVERTRALRQQCGFAAYGSGFPFIRPAQNRQDVILDVLSLIKMEEGSMGYDPVKRFRSQLPDRTLFFVVGPEQVEAYFSKVQAEKSDLSTVSLGIMRKNDGRAAVL